MTQYTTIDSTSEIHYPDSEIRWPEQWRSRRKRRIDLEVSFWRDTSIGNTASECWTWIGQKSTCGYGQMHPVRGAKVQAHRFSWFLHNGFLPCTSVFVCHQCNNKLCVNPDHLYLGTHQENMRDAWEDGLFTVPPSQGEQNGRAKLTWELVDEIRLRYASGETDKRALGRKFGVTDVQIGHIVTHKQWRR